MKVFYCIFFVTILSVVSADINFKSINDELRETNHSVRLIDSNVPDQHYAIDAIGIAQQILNNYTVTSELAIKFIQLYFQEYHTEAIWKVASNCSYLVLPYNAWYIKLQEIISETEITLFATPFDPVPSTSTAKPSTSSSTTTIAPTTTGSPIPFSVTEENYNNVDTSFIIQATGLLQFYLNQEGNFDKALPEFLESLQEFEDREVWKVAGACSYVESYTDYVWLYESYTQTDIIVFA
ncbi:hypothetical protein ABEB36_012497 [Hypothenemus hampei]|uniref:Uncharacterized protein n=1 Tax=Hypothenemus hampei TaxID=57062 RepID=A0ABD1EDG5_HYPHA